MILAGYSVASGSKLWHMLNCRRIVEAYLPVDFTNLCAAQQCPTLPLDTLLGVLANGSLVGCWGGGGLLVMFQAVLCITALRFFE